MCLLITFKGTTQNVHITCTQRWQHLFAREAKIYILSGQLCSSKLELKGRRVLYLEGKTRYGSGSEQRHHTVSHALLLLLPSLSFSLELFAKRNVILLYITKGIMKTVQKAVLHLPPISPG